MKILYNKIIPFGKNTCITIWPLILIKDKYKCYVNDIVLNEEYIHAEQQKELLLILFYILYGLEYIIRLIIHRDFRKAHDNISFEREAIANRKDLTYLSHRKLYAWIKYIIDKK